MMASVLSVVDPGDKVIVFSPFYENYGADAILSGADPIYVPLTPPDFSLIPRCWKTRSASTPRP
jgi:aminotransferase